jgi:hypothetical protein
MQWIDFLHFLCVGLVVDCCCCLLFVATTTAAAAAASGIGAIKKQSGEQHATIGH